MAHQPMFPGSRSRTGGITPEGRRFYDIVAAREEAARTAPFTFTGVSLLKRTRDVFLLSTAAWEIIRAIFFN